MCRTVCGFCCISDSCPFPEYLLVSISSANSSYSSFCSFPLLWVGRFFKPWLCVFSFVSTCETKFWKSVGFPRKCWLSAWVFGDMGLHIQQSCSLLPQSNKRFVLNFVLPTVSLCLISPAKELHSQLPLLRIPRWMYLSSEASFVDRWPCLTTVTNYSPNKQGSLSIRLEKEQLGSGSREEKRIGQVDA